MIPEAPDTERGQTMTKEQITKSPLLHVSLSAANFLTLIGLIFVAGWYWHEFENLRDRVPKLSKQVEQMRESMVRIETRLEFMYGLKRRESRRSRTNTVPPQLREGGH